MNIVLSGAAIIILINSFLCLSRVIRGPSIQDRVLAINIVGTKTLALLILISYIFKSSLYLDVAMVYALLNFIVTVAVSHYVESEGGKNNDPLR